MIDKDITEVIGETEEMEFDESVASDTLKPSPSKAEMLATFTSLMSQLGKEDLSKFLDDALNQIGKEAESTPSATAPGKSGMGQMHEDAPVFNVKDPNGRIVGTHSHTGGFKPSRPDGGLKPGKHVPPGHAIDHSSQVRPSKLNVKEDIDELFQGQELSEEFKEKASTLFEAAVSIRVDIEKVKIEEEYENNLTEEVGVLVDRLDQYLDYSIENWLEENKIAVEKSIRSEIAEEFLAKLHDLFIESNINVPEERLDIVAEMSDTLDKLQSKLDESVNTQIQLQNLIDTAEKETVFDEMSDGMIVTHAEKLRVLSEGIDFTDAESYRKKIGVIKEKYFAKSKTTTNIITEEVAEADEPKKVVPAGMVGYVSAISKSVKI